MSAKIALTATLITALLSGCATNKTPESSPADETVAASSDTDASIKADTKADDVADVVVNDTSDTAVGNAISIDSDMAHPELVASLPQNIESFEIEAAQSFDVEGDGVTVRYTNPRKHRRADVFLYPVSEENRALKHPELVMGSTQATMRAISQAVQEGVYHNLDVIDAATKAYGLRTIARVQATYLRENLASYTLVYQTEHDGTMVKIRMTMPDNATNRESREWDRFVDVVLDAVTEKLDEQNAAAPSTKKTAAL